MTYQNAIEEILSNDAVSFEVVAEGLDNSQHYIKITSTREVISDEMRDLILNHWQQAIQDIFNSEIIEINFGHKITGLVISQYDMGFDAHNHQLTTIIQQKVNLIIVTEDMSLMEDII
jgi:hypothetical protein